MRSSALSSYSVSDDESDEIAGNTRFRPRRRTKNTVSCRSGDSLRRAVRITIRWFPALLLLSAFAILLFEISKLAGKLREGAKPEIVRVDESLRNLNRLDPITRVVRGVREPCLKILHPQEIRKLEFPASADTKFSFTRVMYKSDSGTFHNKDNATLLQQHSEASSFNSFTGYQTYEEREESFKVKESVVIHCGFCSENGGFKVSDDDKTYMQTCKAVVSTCAFGGGDDLYQPIGMTEASLEKVCYMAFWDEITESAQKEEGKMMDDNHMIGKWRVVVVRELPFSDQRLNGKIPKMLSHRLFPLARYSIWVDSKSQFRRDPLGVLEALLWRSKSILAISEHGARSNLYDEAKAIIEKHKATPEEVEVQLNQYRQDGMPADRRINGKKALAEASVIVREHTPLTNLFMCMWFNEVVRFTSRDQLSFPYVLWRLKIPGIHMFPVCTRRDLVNSMGHRRKVKPLVKG